MENIKIDEKRPNVLIVDDDTEMSDFLEMCLKEQNCRVVPVYNGKSALKKVEEENFDLIILDINMPVMDGLEVCKRLKSNVKTKHIPVIMITARDDSKVMLECYEAGADEFLKKPFTALEILVRARAMLRIKSMHDELNMFNLNLKGKVEEKTKELQLLYIQTIHLLANIIEAKDSYTRSHSQKVAEYSVEIAREMGLDDFEITKIRQAAELHDLGKIAIHDNILSKKEKLNEEEREEIKRHSLMSAEILKPLLSMNDIAGIVIQHHERFDGKGYPYSTSGTDIPLGARIIAVADAFEAMTSNRSYRKSMSFSEAIEELKNNSGTQFDPDVVNTFLKILERKKEKK